MKNETFWNFYANFSKNRKTSTFVVPWASTIAAQMYDVRSHFSFIFQGNCAISQKLNILETSLVLKQFWFINDMYYFLRLNDFFDTLRKIKKIHIFHE